MDPAPRRTLSSFLLRGSTQVGLFLILVVLWAVFANLAPGFLSKFNLNSLLRSVAVDIVVGFAQMVVLATGGMNLSVGAIGVCAVMFAGYLMQVLGLPIPVAIAGTLALASVTTKLLTPVLTMAMPLSQPRKAPSASVPAIATGIGSPSTCIR